MCEKRLGFILNPSTASACLRKRRPLVKRFATASFVNEASVSVGNERNHSICVHLHSNNWTMNLWEAYVGDAAIVKAPGAEVTSRISTDTVIPKTEIHSMQY